MSNSRSRQIERAWDCITAAKEVTEILFEATRKLESQYPLPSRFSQYYAPLEDLKNCEYFENNVTDYSPRHIKVQDVAFNEQSRIIFSFLYF